MTQKRDTIQTVTFVICCTPNVYTYVLAVRWGLATFQLLAGM